MNMAAFQKLQALLALQKLLPKTNSRCLTIPNTSIAPPLHYQINGSLG